MDDMEEAFQRRKRRELEQARMAGAGEMQARCSRWFAATKSAATILAPAAAVRSTRSAAEQPREAAAGVLDFRKSRSRGCPIQAGFAWLGLFVVFGNRRDDERNLFFGADFATSLDDARKLSYYLPEFMPKIAAIRRAAFALSVVCLVALTGAGGLGRASANPQLVLWAWERPESLRFVDSSQVGIAFLAESIYLNREPVLRPRLQPLQVGKSTPLIAVVRLEVTSNTPRRFDEAYRKKLAQWIAGTSALPQVRGVQIDFDATQSQRNFYRALLADVRALVPPTTPISITALGSWCMGDDWLNGLPINEAVPMLFRMGKDRQNIVRALAAGDDFREPLCRTSVGVSTDEPWPHIAPGRRVYVFNPRAWTEASYQTVQREFTP